MTYNNALESAITTAFNVSTVKAQTGNSLSSHAVSDGLNGGAGGALEGRGPTVSELTDNVGSYFVYRFNVNQTDQQQSVPQTLSISPIDARTFVFVMRFRLEPLRTRNDKPNANESVLLDLVETRAGTRRRVFVLK